MKNPLLKKANVPDNLPGPPKKTFDGIYYEAIGGGKPEDATQVGGLLAAPKKTKNAYYMSARGGEPGSDNGMSSVYSKQYSGGYFDKFETLPTLKNFVENDMGIKRRASVKVGQRRSKVAGPRGMNEPYMSECDYCKSVYMVDPTSPNHGNGLCSQCSDFSDELAIDEDDYYDEKNRAEMGVYAVKRLENIHEKLIEAFKKGDFHEYQRLHDEARQLIEEHEAARQYGQKNMLNLPSPKHVGLNPADVKRQQREGIENAVKEYLPTPDKKVRTPRFKKDDKDWLKSMGIQAAQEKAWNHALEAGLIRRSANRYVFTKDASAEIRTGFTPIVAQVNRRMSRLHIPKNAGAHEAAIKEIAKHVAKENRQLDKMAAFAESLLPPMEITAASKKPKCPHCGSTKFALMPTDFETAKCDKCGKNWEMGIVKGINDPSDSKTASWTAPDTARMEAIQKEAGKKEWLALGLAPFLMTQPGNSPKAEQPAAPRDTWAQTMNKIPDNYKSEDVEDRRPGAPKPTLWDKTKNQVRQTVIDVKDDYQGVQIDKQLEEEKWERGKHSSKKAYMTDKEKAEYTRQQMDRLKDGHELNTRLDDHLEVKTCSGCGEQFYANRNDGDYCCYEHSDGYWHGAPEGAGAEKVSAANVNLDHIDLAEAKYLAEGTWERLMQDPATLSNEELEDIRDRKYGVVDTLNMGEDDPEFLALADAFYFECKKRGIDPGFLNEEESAEYHRNHKEAGSPVSIFHNTMNKMASKLDEGEGDQYQDIDDPVCLCGHLFKDHERACDLCEDCTGFTPASMEKQVTYVCEHRSFAPVPSRSGTRPLVFARDPKRKEGILMVFIEGDKVIKAEFNGGQTGDETETREGWEGFYSFTQAYGD